MKASWWWVPVAVSGWVFGGGLAGGQEFRIENAVYVGNSQDPVARSTTVFSGGRVYDFLNKPAEITVFDPAGGRFMLLDVSRKMRTELPTTRVQAFTARLRKWAAAQSDPALQFLADPQFVVRYDGPSGQLDLESRWMTYRVKTMAASEALADQYREFSDWYAQLNTMLNPGTRPPFGRLKLNELLHEHSRIPLEVLLETRSGHGLLARPTRVRTEHQLVDQLAEADRDRLAQTDQFLAMFQAVDFSEYQRRMAD